MHYLELRSVSARWVNDETTLGHSKESPVTMSANPGDWIAVVGINGVGKSTLLHAISGTANYVAGSISVLGRQLSPRNVFERFEAGVQFVPQGSALDDILTFADAVNLVRYHRPTLYNEKAISDLEKQMRSVGMLAGDDLLEPRIFDLTCAILSVPRVLVLDEIMPAWPDNSDIRTREEAYRWIQCQLPRTTVVFTEHNVDTALEVASHVLVLEPKDNVPMFMEVTEAARDVVGRSLTLESDVLDEVESGETEEEDWQRIVDFERPVISELRLALRVAFPGDSEMRRKWRGDILRDFGFLSTRRSVAKLSGGQQTILQWFMLSLSGLGQMPIAQLGHLDQDHRERLTENWWGIEEKIRSSKSRS